MRSSLTVAAALLALSSSVSAQELKAQAPGQPTAPKTRLEAFTGESGAVILKGYTSTGIVRHRGSVDVSAMTLKNAKTGEETKGLLISLGDLGRYVSETSAFVDYDEINGLLAGIDYVAGADTSSTKLANFEAIYSTKGDLRIVVFNDSAATLAVSVKTSRFGQNVFLRMSDLAKVREAVAAAKQILDNPDSVAAKGPKLATPVAAPAMPEPVTATPSPTAAPAPKPKPRSVPAAPSAPGAPMRLN